MTHPVFIAPPPVYWAAQVAEHPSRYIARPPGVSSKSILFLYEWHTLGWSSTSIPSCEQLERHFESIVRRFRGVDLVILEQERWPLVYSPEATLYYQQLSFLCRVAGAAEVGVYNYPTLGGSPYVNARPHAIRGSVGLGVKLPQGYASADDSAPGAGARARVEAARRVPIPYPCSPVLLVVSERWGSGPLAGQVMTDAAFNAYWDNVAQSGADGLVFWAHERAEHVEEFEARIRRRLSPKLPPRTMLDFLPELTRINQAAIDRAAMRRAADALIDGLRPTAPMQLLEELGRFRDEFFPAPPADPAS